jgi:hypothetical protein
VSARYDVPGRVALTRIELDGAEVCCVSTVLLDERFLGRATPYETIVIGGSDEHMMLWCSRDATREEAIGSNAAMVARVLHRLGGWHAPVAVPTDGAP